jgi:hypothetical protein
MSDCDRTTADDRFASERGRCAMRCAVILEARPEAASSCDVIHTTEPALGQVSASAGS